jgi:hypothetical protein
LVGHNGEPLALGSVRDRELTYSIGIEAEKS